MQNVGNKISNKLLDLEFQRKSAKIALSASLGILTITAFNMKNKKAAKLHTIAGAAMVGFSLWHAGLYGTKYAKFLNKHSKKRLKASEV
ncbi:helicase [Campylobacter fetus]|uniref:Helicase n=3 Tax=Campylobacter fetus TaxID=196 RepID=A0A5L4K8I2_CAMFE|nr:MULTISPECIES: hypothetical protein [Campylobacter]OCS23373.1 hypothetical protein CFVI97532_00940 [Campylobacter fetus subsp. venerealis cfvi97/532]OCS26337.1 hypothetical protein CFVB10_04395 [Campylobacter fetus subsp. venerealis cfvB10]OCS30739.1 hypothetical protein CFVCCUG33900_01245 [Campylobacter fetus subsp. venerealis LMG 6570 = CCUG 33900]OCS43017.1 hypothetical protein CFVI02298_01845 [Campylobacter fetus subsp. venerealis cfvi02/298]AHE94231.1 hypothetical protein CFVI03293_0920